MGAAESGLDVKKGKSTAPAALRPSHKEEPPVSPTASSVSRSAPKPDAKKEDKPKKDKLDGRNDGVIVLGKYMMFKSEKDILGSGASSTCYKGKVLATQQPVAIKMYNEQRDAKDAKDLKKGTLAKFRRQIEVLNEMQQPFIVPADKRLAHEYLLRIKPESVFMQVLDYSKDASGQPGPDASDGIIYVVTEAAQYSLKDFLQDRRKSKTGFTRIFIRELVKRVVLAMSALHAKGYVHLDMKPENLMVFNGVLKVIDVDGCVKIGSNVKIGDNTISFSPVYCAPEWAKFILEGGNASIVVCPELDVWSVGMLIMEFITMEPVWNPIVARLMCTAGSHKHGVFKFLEYFISHNEAPIPKIVREKDEGLNDLLKNYLLAWKQQDRKNFAEVLHHPYLMEGGWDKYLTTEAMDEVVAQEAPASRTLVRHRTSEGTPGHDAVNLQPMFKGTLWKLRKESNAMQFANWTRRDMWIAHNHSLCYYSLKENKRQTLISAAQFTGAHFELFPESVKDFAFKVVCHGKEDNVEEEFFLAAENHEGLEQWMDTLQQTSVMEMVVTYQLGEDMKEAVEAYRCAVNNRRMRPEAQEGGGSADGLAPVFKAKLYKLKTSGDRFKEKDWYERDMWISQNNSLVYFSPKQEGPLLYYTSTDIAGASLTECPSDIACRPHVFQVVLAACNGVEFEPAYFAAESEDMRISWMKALRSVGA